MDKEASAELGRIRDIMLLLKKENNELKKENDKLQKQLDTRIMFVSNEKDEDVYVLTETVIELQTELERCKELMFEYGIVLRKDYEKMQKEGKW